MSLLYITANPKQMGESYGLQLGEHFLKHYQKLHPSSKVTKLDLFAEQIPPLEGDALAAWEKQSDAEVTNTYVEQFLKYKQVVFVTPLWNMGVPSPVKAYIDHLILPGKTFRFGEKGIEGLLQDTRVLHLQSRGGIYSEGKLAAFEHGDSYLRTIFKLVGVKQYEHIYVEGTSTYPEEAVKRLEAAKLQAEKTAETFL
ncbi:FMN-dependent NADH-azoreductase [Alkalicoccus daliensis]|uniref:FMN dependent NADH:quinone oxidoreductase n=1 Tax=Alkalicoccus daliensis TaxID=745820 RepID=A0A1H0K854_9BACI|nr:NAD(P)H-dependent oxidoreductase [Alkalicoccus daliensis]SDO52096.1 FMN-dependent NADH-azoreductase [Alkalicoccus daliensis]